VVLEQLLLSPPVGEQAVTVGRGAAIAATTEIECDSGHKQEKNPGKAVYVAFGTIVSNLGIPVGIESFRRCLQNNLKNLPWRL